MNPSVLLDRLEGVRETRADQWIARCPAHEDRAPSLSIRNVNDRLLVHCFAGCPVGDVIAAVGLSVGDLFDERPEHRDPGRVHRVDYCAVLRALRHELSVVVLATEDFAAGFGLNERDQAALERARDNVQKALDAANV